MNARMRFHSLPLALPFVAGLAGLGCAPPAADVVTLGSIALEVPEPGLRVWSEVIYDDGTVEVAGLFIDDDGERIIDESEGADGSSEGSLVALDASPCSDGARSHLGHRWNTRFDWSFNAGTSPIDVSDAEAAIKRGTRNITTSRNGCDLEDNVSATQSYLGRTSTPTQIRSDGGCNTGDGKNVVGFGDLPLGVLGVACTYSTADGVAVESDVRLNKADHKWTTEPSPSCTTRFDVEAVMTHERGHTFGLGHVSEGNHAALTMSTQIRNCQKSERTLARGDVLGLRDLY